MPELPEVETVRRGLEAWLPRRRLDHVELRREDLRWPIPVDAVHDLVGRRCLGLGRRSKYLLLPFDGPGDPTAMIHLGMSGRLFLDMLKRASDSPDWRLHEHWRMRFGRRLLRYVDPRRFGALDVFAADHPSPLLDHLGPEPLGPDFTPDYLFAKSRKRKLATKPFLMDAKVVVGVGNIYASESCFRAAIRPRRAAGRLTRIDCQRLHDSITQVLQDAIDAGGTTLRDYVGVDESTGYFQRELSVYGREAQPCHRCSTPIRHLTLGQRSTFYCPTCQH